MVLSSLYDLAKCALPGALLPSNPSWSTDVQIVCISDQSHGCLLIKLLGSVNLLKFLMLYSLLLGLIVCVEVLLPSQSIRVMSNLVSLPNHTFFSGRLSPLSS